MEKLKCYISEIGPSRHNWVLYFAYLTALPVYFVATILAYFDTELALGASGSSLFNNTCVRMVD